MISIISPAPTYGRVARELAKYLNSLFRSRSEGQVLQVIGKGDLPQSPVTVFMRPVGKPSAMKMRDPGATGKTGAARALWESLKPPGKFGESYGTFWRSEATGGLVVGIPHPVSVPYAWRTPIAWWLAGARNLSQRPDPSSGLFKWKLELEPPLSRLFDEDMGAADIETIGFHGDITYFGYADSKGGCSWAWTPEVKAAVRDWLARPTAKIFQNYVFDVPRLEASCGVQIAGDIHDTMAMRSAYTRQWPYGLQFLASQFFLIDPWKTEYREGNSNEALYNAKDTYATYCIAAKLIKLMPALLSTRFNPHRI